MMPGSSSTWTEKNRATKSCPGNSPPKRNIDRYVPTIGTDRTAPSMNRTPVPESRSSGSE